VLENDNYKFLKTTYNLMKCKILQLSKNRKGIFLHNPSKTSFFVKIALAMRNQFAIIETWMCVGNLQAFFLRLQKPTRVSRLPTYV